MPQNEILIGPTAWQEAERRASYGHKAWICWVEEETGHAARMTHQTIKRAMLATGTQGYMFQPGFGLFKWPTACIMLRNAHRGYL